MPFPCVVPAISPLTLPSHPGSCQWLANCQDGTIAAPEFEAGGRLGQVYEGFSRRLPLGSGVGGEILHPLAGVSERRKNGGLTHKETTQTLPGQLLSINLGWGRGGGESARSIKHSFMTTFRLYQMGLYHNGYIF